MRDPGREYDAVFMALYPRARGLAFRLTGDTETAEDVGSEAMARLFMHWDRIGTTTYRDGWVLRVTANLALDVVRRRRREGEVGAPMSTVGVVDDAAEVVVLRAALVEALAVLPRRQREAIVLTYLVGLSPGDAAAAMRVSSSSLSQLVKRGLARLRTRVGDGIDADQFPLRIEGSTA